MVNDIGMDLFERSRVKSLAPRADWKKAAIFGNVFARIPFHEAKIENFLSIENACAAGPSAESMNKPGKFAKGVSCRICAPAGKLKCPGCAKRRRAPGSCAC